MPGTVVDRERRVDEAGTAFPYRTFFVSTESMVALGGVAGAVQLITGTFTPPVADLAPLGLSSWVLPGLWLFSSVAVPSAAAGWLAWRRSPQAPTALLIASGLLAVELAVQIPLRRPQLAPGRPRRRGHRRRRRERQSAPARLASRPGRHLIRVIRLSRPCALR